MGGMDLPPEAPPLDLIQLVDETVHEGVEQHLAASPASTNSHDEFHDVPAARARRVDAFQIEGELRDRPPDPHDLAPVVHVGETRRWRGRSAVLPWRSRTHGHGAAASRIGCGRPPHSLLLENEAHERPVAQGGGQLQRRQGGQLERTR